MNILGRSFERASAISNWTTHTAVVPRARGVYAICCASGLQPTFLPKSPGGWWKDGRDPTMDTARLARRWNDDSRVLYLGAGENLRDRIDLLVAFGCGLPARHWGGRALWQLEGIAGAEIYWLLTPSDCERCVENELLAAFRSIYGRLPYANIAGFRKHGKCWRA